jgi:hypothetical protein
MVLALRTSAARGRGFRTRRGHDHSEDPEKQALVLDPDVTPLVPAEPARRIAVCGCSCGEPGCGCVAPLICEHAGFLTWSDFRDYTGVYDGPAVKVNPGGGVALAFPGVAFDAARYRAEVERATADRWWESPQLRAARLLRGHLDQQAGYLAGLGWKQDKLCRPGTRAPSG